MKSYKSNKTITLFLVILIFLIILCSFTQANEKIFATLTQYKIYLDNVNLVFKSPIITVEDKTYVPLRELAERLGIEVEWSSDEEKISLNKKMSEDNYGMISIMVFSSNSNSISYKIDLSADGQLTTTIGIAYSKPGSDDKNLSWEVANFTPKVVKYKNLSDFDNKELTNLMSKITIDEKPNGAFAFDAWYVTINYQGESYRYIYSANKNFWHGSEHMYDIIEKLVEHSPIKITLDEGEVFRLFNNLILDTQLDITQWNDPRF